MKNLILMFSLVLVSLHAIAQNGWKTESSVITGEKFVYKEAIYESGKKSGEAIKVWKEGDSYFFTIIFTGTLNPCCLHYSSLTHEVRVDGEWKTWWYGKMLKATPMYTQRVQDFKAGDMLKLSTGIETIYVDLSGSTAALNSL